MEIINYVGNLDKKIIFFVIVIVLFIGAYSQLQQTHELIKSKKDSYEPVKLAGLWIKENSDKGDIVISKSPTQITYYSERETYGMVSNEEIKKLKPKYLMISIFEQHSPELLKRVEDMSSHLEIVNGYFMDSEGKQAALIVYEFKDYDF